MILTFEVTLFGSLAATGKGHLTDVAIKQVFKERKIKIIWKPEIFLNRYPNGMTINAIKEEKVIDTDGLLTALAVMLLLMKIQP